MILTGCHDGASPAAPPGDGATTVDVGPAPASVSTSTTPLDAAPFTPEKVSLEGKAMGDAPRVHGLHHSDARCRCRCTPRWRRPSVEIKRVESLMTTWRPDSEISQINAAAGDHPVAIGEESFAVVKEALHTSEISQGTFDITFEGLHGLWKFDEDLDPHPPHRGGGEEATPARSATSTCTSTRRSARSSSTRRGWKISLGGIAKGYGIDRATAVLDKAGLSSFYAQAGGDLFARGKKPDGSPWIAGVRDPRGADGRYFAIFARHRSRLQHRWRLRAHLLRGRQALPPHHRPRAPASPATASRSVTIYAKTALQADAIDDAVFILGPVKGLALVDSLPDVGAVIVDAQNNLAISKSLLGKLSITAEPTDAP